MSDVHAAAIVEDGARLHESVKIGPHTIVEAGAVIGEGCRIESSVRISGHTRMGRGNRVCHGAVLGAEPQDLGFEPAKSRPLTIGDDNHFKEGVHISRGLKSEAGTTIGDRNYLMGNFHAGHDCRIGNDNTLGHGSMLAGHVELEDHVFISGLVAVHQFCRIGAHAIVAGQSAMNQDVPPYVMVQGTPARFVGPNKVGLRRAGFTPEQRRRIKDAYKTIYRSDLRLEEALVAIDAGEPAREVAHIIRFITASERGIVSAR